MKTVYSSNNSGGDWWLEDEHWKALEKAGWNVDWVADWIADQKGFKDKCGTRWLGALAREATREGLSLREAAREWEDVTGLASADEGCPCCGQPHNFTEYDDDGKYVKSGPTVSYTAEW